MIFYWWFVNLASEAVSRRVPRDRRLFLKYEDLVRSPDQTLMRIGRMVGTDMTDLASAVVAGQPMAVHHTIGGSNLRFEGRVSLGGEDLEWVRRLSAKDRRAIERLCAWPMRRYGYDPGAPVPATRNDSSRGERPQRPEKPPVP
jgi:hypothetical protein